MGYRFIFQLIHTRVVDTDNLGDSIVDKKELGVYSCRAHAEEAQKRYALCTGFCDYPDRFSIVRRRIDMDGDIEKLSPGMAIYCLENEYCENDYDIVTDFGFFTSKEHASAMIQKLVSQKNRERKYLGVAENYTVGEFILDCDNPFWSEGFIRDELI